MTRSYKLVLLDEVVIGMQLSDNLIDRHGKILLPEGTSLTEQHMESLRRQEVDMVPVYSEELSEAEIQARNAEREARLGTLFRKKNYDAPEDNANEILLQHMLRFRQGGEA